MKYENARPKKKTSSLRRTLLPAALGTLILAAATALGAFVVPAILGPGLPPRVTAYIAIGCFLAGLALCGMLYRYKF